MNEEWKDGGQINIISYINKEEKSLVEEGGNGNGLDMDEIVGRANPKADLNI